MMSEQELLALLGIDGLIGVGYHEGTATIRCCRMFPNGPEVPVELFGPMLQAGRIEVKANNSFFGPPARAVAIVAEGDESHDG